MSDTDRERWLQHGRVCLIRKLGSLARLSTADAAAIEALPLAVEEYPARSVLAREGDRSADFHLILDGFASRHKSLSDGARQILSFHTPGDILDLQSLYIETMDFGVSTVIPTVLGRIPRGALQNLADDHPAVARAFLRDTLVDAAIYREWMLGLGRRTARSHLAHLLCEVVARLQIAPPPADVAAGALAGPIPLTRPDLADALGLTVVEVNRELGGLANEGLIEAGAATVTVLNYRALARSCGFDPSYLHQDRAA